MSLLNNNGPRCLLAGLLMALGAAATADDVECTIFPPAEIVPGQAFDVRVSRVPGYPGGWFSPTLYLRVGYPTNAGWSYVQQDVRTVPKMGVIRLDATLFAPTSLYPDPSGGLVAGGPVSIVAIVREPAGDTYINTVCSADTVVSP